MQKKSLGSVLLAATVAPMALALVACDDDGGGGGGNDDAGLAGMTGSAGNLGTGAGPATGGNGVGGDADINTMADAGSGDAVVGPSDWAGSYAAMGVWDLSGPITAQRTLGDVVSDFLVEEIVSRSGVPSLVEDEATDVVEGSVGDRVSNLVDANSPDALKPDSQLMQDLATVLASTEVTSTITLAHGNPLTEVTGTEVLHSFTFGWQNNKTALPVGELLEQTPGAVIDAEWVGEEDGVDGLDIEPHEFALRLGTLVLWIVDNVLMQAGSDSLSQMATDAIDCDAIATTLLGGQDELSFGAGGLNYGVDASDLAGACAAAEAFVGMQVLGLFDVDSSVEIGGPVQYVDDNRDGLADRLVGRDGYGGIVNKVRGSIAPRVTATLQAARQ